MNEAATEREPPEREGDQEELEPPERQGHQEELEPPERQGDQEELIMFLEHDQLVSGKTRPLPRAVLSTRMATALWALRVFVLIVSAMVIYTFVSKLG